MAGSYIVVIEGLSEQLKSFEDLPADIVRKARMAVNATTRRSRTMAARSIRRQVNFPARYLSGEKSRLQVTQLATNARLEGVVTGRQRATSLARFAKGSLKVGGARSKGVTVEVKPGLARRMPGAFFMKLRAGSDDLAGAFNVGIAVRTKGGKKPSAAYRPLPLGNGLWLLYGPSVDQVFKETRGQIKPEMETYMAGEFLRLMDLKL